MLCSAVQATNLSSFNVLGSICISWEGRGRGQGLGSAQHFGKPSLAGERREALLASLAVFTFTLCRVYMVDRQNLLIGLVSLRSVV